MEVAALRINTYPDLLRQLDRRRRELGLRMEDLDHVSGLQGGYSAKLFCGMRRFGELSLSCLLGALECDLVVVPRAEASPAERRALSADKAGAFDRVALPPTGEC